VDSTVVLNKQCQTEGMPMAIDEVGTQPPTTPRVLLFSNRNIYERKVWRCSFNEFEGILQQIDAVEVVAPKPTRWYRNGKRLASRLGEHLSIPLNPGVQKVMLDREYDIFAAFIEVPSELFHLCAVDDWKRRCKTSICWVIEFYVKDIPTFKSALEMLSRFDHVVFMAQAIEPFRKWVGEAAGYLPPGVDAIRFCPFPDPPRRSIDVLSIGRRSPETHHALLQLARHNGFFYMYDTINSLDGYDLEEHRQLFANMAKRARYFLVNPGKINKAKETGGQHEFGYRYFEAAAAGTLMIGERAHNNKEFDRIFHWDGAVTDLPFGSDRVGDIIREVEMDPERRSQIRKRNITECLLHHDWAYRWEFMLQLAGLAPLPGLVQRKERLRQLAKQVQEARVEP
jgi:hypothetical protein